MKIHCDVIRDLLPLYYDGVCSVETRILVEEHLKNCQSCREELKLLSGQITVAHPVISDQAIVDAASAAWKRSRRSSFIRGTAIAIAVMCILWAFFVFPFTKNGTIATVRIWEASLTHQAVSLLGEKAVLPAVLPGYRVDPYPEEGCVFFRHTGITYTGIFYTVHGAPVGFQGTAAEFQKHGDGWLWREQGGDNWMYAEHIVGNWYWYEMHF